jgi:hypothetical protein
MVDTFKHVRGHVAVIFPVEHSLSEWTSVHTCRALRL